MKTVIIVGITMLVTLVAGQCDKEGESEFGPFENVTHRCNFDCSRAIDLALIVDASGSIKATGADNWDKVIEFVINVIDNFQIGPLQTHVALQTFSTLGRTRILLNKFTDAQELKEEIRRRKDEWYEDGWTNTYDAFLKMRTEIFTVENGDRPRAPNVAIFVTDGQSSHHERPDLYKDPVPQAQLAEQEGISVYVVGVTNQVLELELKEISKSPHVKGETYWTTPSFDSITTVMQDLLQQTCVAVCVRKTMVCEKAIDLAFVVDASGSIQREEEKEFEPPQNTNWWLIMGFLKNIIDKLSIGPNKIQVAVVTFSNLGITRVKLNDYEDAARLKAATNDYRWYGGGRTNTWEGLHKMRTEVFTQANGDRPTAPNVAILITDGMSSHNALPQKYRNPIPEAKLAKETDQIHIFGIGVTADVDFQEIEAIASRPANPDDKTVFSAQDFDTLTDVLQSVLEEMAGQTCRYL